MPPGLSKQQIADRLDEAAELLEAQAANPFRVSAYRNAADTVRQLEDEPGEILEMEGLDGLIRLPNIGVRIARAIDEMSQTGRWVQLERMRGEAEPEELFRSVPGIGPETARRLHDTLHLDTLEALEIAAHDGRLETVPWIGPRRATAIRASLGAMLVRRGRRGAEDHDEPSVDQLLGVDRTYRKRTRAGSLRTIAPRRFNPSGEAWLPILHLEQDEWSFTALYSNTARAHELGRTHDWVVIYFGKAEGREHTRTVVTETHGPLEGKRVVRGRELECQSYYFRDDYS